MAGERITVENHSLSGKIQDKYLSGKQEGYEIGFETIGKKITIKPGYYSMWYGPPACGKTRKILCLCVYLAKTYNLNFLLYSKEEGLPDDLMILLIQIWTGKPFYYKGYAVDRLTLEEVQRAELEISEHFCTFSGRLSGFEDLVTKTDEAERETGKTFFGIVADPLNTLVTAGSNIAGMYEEGLDILLDYLQKHQKHCFLGQHPANPKDSVKNDANGVPQLRPTQPWELGGGQTLWRKGYLMISLHRFQPGDLNSIDGAPHGEEFKGNELLLIVQKAKPEGVAKTGQYILRYDRDRHNYYEKLDNGTFRFNVDIGEAKEHETQKLQPNRDFYPDEGIPPVEEAPF